MKFTSENNMSSICDICESESICSTSHSRLAPVTYNACDKCININAENLNVISTWLLFHDESSLNESFLSTLRAYHNGSYIEWPEIKIYFNENKDLLNKQITESDDEFYEEI